MIDYKTGKVRDEKSAQLQGGRMLQLPLYALAGAQLLDVDGAAGEVAYVYPTRRGDFKTVRWSGEELAERHDDVVGLLVSVLDGVGARRLHDRSLEGRRQRLSLLRLQ